MHIRGVSLFILIDLCVLGTAVAQEPTPPAPSPTPVPVVSPEPTPAPVPSPEVQEPERLGKREPEAAVSKVVSDDDGDGEGMHLGPFHPSIAIVSSGARPGPMLKLWAPDLGESRFDVYGSAAYSLYKYEYYDFRAGLLPHRDDGHPPSFATGTNYAYPYRDLLKTPARKFDLYGTFRYRSYPRQHFYGLGPDSLAANRSDYHLSDRLFEVVSDLRLGSWLTLSARGGLLQPSLGPGDDDADRDTGIVFRDASAPGLLRQPDLWHGSGVLLLDTRDEPRNPHGGGMLAVAASRYSQRNGSEFAFNRLVLEARQFLRLGSRRSILALRALTALTDADSGRRIPFYLMPSLGGSHFLRGFHSYRFTDNNAFAFNTEYRFEVVPKVELAAFYDGGKVFGDRDDFEFRGLETTWGGGIRIKSAHKVRVRLDVGRSREDTRFYVKFGPAF